MATQTPAEEEIKISTQEPTTISRKLTVTLPNDLGEWSFEVRLECENLFFQLKKIVIQINTISAKNDQKIFEILVNIQNQVTYHWKLNGSDVHSLRYQLDFSTSDGLITIIISPTIRTEIIANINAIFSQITKLIELSVKKAFVN